MKVKAFVSKKWITCVHAAEWHIKIICLCLSICSPEWVGPSLRYRHFFLDWASSSTFKLSAFLVPHFSCFKLRNPSMWQFSSPNNKKGGRWRKIFFFFSIILQTWTVQDKLTQADFERFTLMLHQSPFSFWGFLSFEINKTRRFCNQVTLAAVA